MKPIQAFSSAVYHARVFRGLTQEQLAEALGISVRWFQAIEKGEGKPSFDLLLRMLCLLDLDARSCVDQTTLQQLPPSQEAQTSQ